MENAIKSDLILFRVADVPCALHCKEVKEIIRNSDDIVKIMRSAETVRGVINLRGEIVTILDLRVVFNLAVVDSDEMVVVVECEEENIGLIVNEVKDVIQHENSLQETPNVKAGALKKEFYTSVIERDNKLIPLLNLGEIFKVAVPEVEDPLVP